MENFMKVNLDGISPAIVTPFTKGGKSVDYDKACAVAEHLVGKGVHGIYVNGTTGEGLLQTLDERKKLLEELVAAVGKKIKVFVQTGCLDTASTIELTEHACQAGAKAAGILTPAFYGYDEKALELHYRAVCKAVKGFPVLLYDIPKCTINALSPAFVIKLVNEIDNLVGLKESNMNMVNFSRLAAGLPKGSCLINGADEYTFQVYVTGATGSVSAMANIGSELLLGIYNNVKKGNLKKAWSFQRKIHGLSKHFQYGNLISYQKEGLRLRGCDAGYVRSPQRELTAAEKKTFAKNMEEAGVI
jgi:4-hydroxy-tetrahydrodipicolinate synthase